MAATALKKITTRAKAIRKKRPGVSWKSAVKQAGKEYRGGKIKPARKKRVSGVKKKAPRKRVGAVKKKVGSTRRPAAVGTVSSHKRAAKKIVEEQLAWNLLNISQAKNETSKRKLQKRSAKLKKELRSLS